MRIFCGKVPDFYVQFGVFYGLAWRPRANWYGVGFSFMDVIK